MKFKVKEPDEIITFIDKWYDRYIRLWCIQCKNKDGDQIGPAFYSNKKGAEIEYKRLLNEIMIDFLKIKN